MIKIDLQVIQKQFGLFEELLFVKDFTIAASQEFYKSFHKLHSNADILVIPIMINSYGGNIDSLFAMIDIIQSSHKPVATIASGVAMSCASLLLASGTKGYRFAGPNAQIMIHQVTTTNNGKLSDIEIDMIQTKKLTKKFFSLLDSFSNKKKGFYKNLIASNKYSDVFLTPQQAKQLKLIDHIAIPTLR